MKIEAIIPIIFVVLILYVLLISNSSDNKTSGRSIENDKVEQIMELEDKVQEYKTCIEDIRYTVDNALSDIKYPISKNDYNAAIDTIEEVDWCGL